MTTGKAIALNAPVFALIAVLITGWIAKKFFIDK